MCHKRTMLSVVSKTKHSKTKTEARSTQNSKTKHPNLENEAPKTRKRSTQISKTKTPKSRKRSTQKLETGLSFINTRPMLIQQELSTITNSPVPDHRAWSQAIILEQILPGSDLILSRSVIDIQYVRLQNNRLFSQNQ